MRLNHRIWMVAVFLLLTIGVRAWVSLAPAVPLRKPLADYPNSFGEWTMLKSGSLSDSISAVLKADDYLLRSYRNQNGREVDFFVAYYQTQRAGESMHSPKNCLPGSGWTPIVNDTVLLQHDARGREVRINRYVIENGADRALVLYWYQANGRIIASEYWGKIYLVWDSLRTGRKDGAIVRLVVPVGRNENYDIPLQTALSFARSATADLPAFLPN